MLKKHALPVILLIIVGTIGTKALLKPGFYSSHDGEHQIVRQYIFDRAIKAGEFPPRFDRQLYNHLGYPLFTFTYQLPFWIGEAFIGLGLSIPWAVKTTFIITYIFSGLAMYLFAQEKWGKAGGFMAAFLYLWAPYRFLTIFVRASLGEHTAFIFLPLLLWSLSLPKRPGRLFGSGRLRIVVGAISIAGLLLSHSMFAQLSAPLIIVFWLTTLWQSKNKPFFILHSSFIILLGLGLSVYYLVPAMYYRKAIQGLNSTFYAEHFVTLKQLFYSKWGYTFSMFGENDGMSFQVGFAQWLAVACGLWLVARGLLNKKIHRTALALLLSFALSVFLMTGASSEIWRKLVSGSFVLDLPWRLLAITTFTASALAAFAISIVPKYLKIGLIGSLIIVALYTNRNHLRINERLDFDNNWFANYAGTSNSYDEYRPSSTSQDLLKQPPLPAVTVEKGSADIHIIDDNPQKLLFDLDAKTTIEGRINTVYFPGWQLYVNNHPGDIKQLTQGVPALRLPPGKYQIKLQYEETNIMKIADLITLAAGAILAIGTFTKIYGKT